MSASDSFTPSHQAPTPTQTPPERGKGLQPWQWIGIGVGALVLIGGVAVGATALLGAIASGQASPSGGDSEAPVPTPVASSAVAEAEPDPASTDASFQARMDEREEFFAAQQVAPGEQLVATTPAQIEFTSRQRDYIESFGMTYSPEYEDLILALGLNACETSILSGHVVDDTAFSGHVATSPQIQASVKGLSEADATQVTKNLTSIMRDGTYYLCPDDYPQWAAGWDAAYGG